MIQQNSIPAAQFLGQAETVADAVDAALAAYESHDVVFGHGFADAEHEVSVLMEHALSSTDDSTDRIAKLLASAEDENGIGYAPVDLTDTSPLTAEQRRLIEDYLHARLVDRKPLPYVLKEAWQGEFPFYVDERVLIPRSYIAELLLDGLQPWIADPEAPMAVLDLCCGSGCLGIIAAHAFPDVEQLWLSDISRDALVVARLNANRYFIDQTKPLVRVIASDVFENIRGQRFDLIISNPPYVTDAAMAALPDEYRHEPTLALAAGENGLAIVDKILNHAADFLNPNGVLVVEVGNNQDLVTQAYPTAPLTWVNTPQSEGAVFIVTREALDAWR